MNSSSVSPPDGRSPGRPARPAPGTAQVAGLVSFPLMGSALTMAGMPMTDVFVLLGGCGAIGAATFAAAGGGRRLAGAVATALVRAAADK
ncbi:hypothetical protein ABT010_39770 [Streptomyces sp. NPDC002668]|uniref:hypothetical protein n=1 Tax=Streptomyces sp. NPDC002668 TaxID=3154422 RepID=UPI00332D1D25